MLFSHCKKDITIPSADLQKEYFPLNINKAVIYEVDSIVHDDFTGQVKSYKFELKDSIVSGVEDGPGRNTVRIERFKRQPMGEYRFQKVFTRTITGLRAEEFIDNRRYVSLIFPPEENITWNGNTYNNLGGQEYRFTDVNVALEINSHTFDSTITVVQKQENNLIREDFLQEVYAKNTGLVKKEIRALDKDISTGAIKKGLIYTMQIKSVN